MWQLKVAKHCLSMNSKCTNLSKTGLNSQWSKKISSSLYEKANFKYHISPVRAVGSNLPNIEPWQQQKLETAFMRGRKHLKVLELSQEVGMDRREVIHWLKEFRSIPTKARESILRARAASWELTEERKLHLKEVKEKKEKKQQAIKDYVSEKWISEAQGEVEEFANRKLSPRVINTLEYIYENNRHPSEEIIKNLFDLYKVPRYQVVKWFSDKRKDDHYLRSVEKKKQRQQKKAELIKEAIESIS